MYVFVLSLHIVLCVLLIFIILMQPGKGADVSSAFGGGASSQLFGASGPGNFLTRGTGLIATMFMFTSISLALMGGQTVTAAGEAVDAMKNVKEDGEEGSGFGLGDKPATPTPEPENREPAVSPTPEPAPEPTPTP